MANETTAGFRLSMAQERVVRQQGEQTPLTARCVVMLEGPLEAARLREALNSTVAANEVLRTVFRRQAGLKLPFQVILDAGACSPAWRESDAASVDALLRREIAFDLAEGPLVHAELAQLASAELEPSRHALLLAMPALLNDARGLANLVEALAHAYAGQPGDDEALQYADIVQWQAEMLESDEAKAGLEFWRGSFRELQAAPPAALRLPGQVAGTGYQPDWLEHPLPASTAAELETLAGTLGVSGDAILLACWVALAARLNTDLAGEPGVTVGCELDGRKYEELEGALGLFAATAPIRFNVDAAEPFATLAAQVNRQLERANEWQECFTWSLEEPQNEARLPLAFSSVSLPETRTAAGVTFGFAAEIVEREPYLLHLVASRRGDTLMLAFHHDASQLAAAAVITIAGSFRTLLDAALAGPQTAVGALPLLDEAGRQQVLVEWNRTETTFPGPATLHAMFEAQAALTPGRPAVRFGDDTLTYAQLDTQANHLAHYLGTLGVGPGSLVGLCLERSTGLIVALLAILKAGGAYVALSPDNPKARLAQQLTDAPVLIIEQSLLDQMPEFGGRTLVLDGSDKPWASHPSTAPEIGLGGDALAYVIHTSGSTGVPKGVMITHANLVNYTQYIQQWLGLAAFPEGLQFATVSTIAADLGNTCVFPSLTSGGCLHLIGHATATDAQALAAYMSAHAVDVLKIVPSHLEALLHAAGAGSGSEAAQVLPRQFLILGGEALTTRLMRTLDALNPACDIRNHYGPTETTIGALTLKLSEYDWKHAQAATIPIGRPIANAQAYILNAQLQPVPVGVAGDLYLAGKGVAAGYLRQPELTAERFIADPFTPDLTSAAAARMYRTGDRARFLPDGLVEFLGREDNQVKLRGFRIELGEIEAALHAHPGVRQALVIAAETETGNPQLLAYVVAADAAVTAETLRGHVQQHVPDYMVPAHLILLPRMPLTANGKLDRAALPAPTEAHAQRVYAAPRTPTEEVIAGIWADVLKRERVGTADDFFELGGHSLLATQVISRIRRALAVDLPLRILFESPTVASLAQHVEAGQREANPEVAAPPMVAVPRTGDLPLSFPQQRLWVLDQMEPNTPLYNIPRRMRLRGPLDRNALALALNALVKRHESQRTTFAVRNGQPVQVIAPELTLHVKFTSLHAWPDETARLVEARRLALEEALTPFDLATGPLLRATLIELAPDDHVLLLTMHHIVSDAWSAGIFFQELNVFYETFVHGTKPDLPELAIQYADYAVWQRAWFTGDVLAGQLAYWRQQLEGAPPVLELRTDRPRPQTQTFRGALQVIVFSAETSATLRRFSREEGTTLFMTLLAGFDVLLSRWSVAGQEQIVVGTDLANRSTVDAERTIGFFINLLAMRTDLSGNPTFRELLGRVREMALGAYAHQEMPFDKIVEELQPERSLSHNPLVQVLFVMQNIPRQKRTLGELTMESFEMPLERAKFDIAVFMVDTDEGLVGNWVYNTDLFDGETIARMAGNFETLLQNAAAAPETRLAGLEMMSAEELLARDDDKKRKKESGLKRLSSAAPKAVVLTRE